MPVTPCFLPSSLAWPKRTDATSLTPGSSATDLAACGVNELKPSVFWMTAWALEPLVTASRNVDFALPAKTDAKVTSATPIISAAAVTAVRPGWRTVFSRAMRPVTPRKRSNGAPTTSAIGPTRRGLRNATPRKVRTAPRPISDSAALGLSEANSPSAMIARPPTVSTERQRRRPARALALGC